MNTFLFTSESVGDGHPDKLSDQISDTLLDAYLRIDPFSKVAIETIVKSDTVILVGEVSSSAIITQDEIDNIVRDVIKSVGYDFDDIFDYKTLKIHSYINAQSSDIAGAIKQDGDDMGAGDQGMMFGYASDETDERMPLTLVLAHRIVARLKACRKEVDWLRPDCKSQVTVEYVNDGGALVPIRVHNVVVSCQHSEDVSTEELRKYVVENVIKRVVDEKLLVNTEFHVQPSGRFIIGGPVGDAGLTGRKIIVDTYGGFGNHGGGCFSGKDASKVDRSGAYAARWIAKSLVCAGLCRRVLVQIAYAIGITEPLSVHVDTFRTGVMDDAGILDVIRSNFDLKPGVVVRELELRKPVFRKTATYGHFGRDEFTWEVPRVLKINGSPQAEK